MPNRMKPETLEETRDRLLEMSAAERRGFDAVSEGQLIPISRNPRLILTVPSRNCTSCSDALRLRRSFRTVRTKSAVKQTQEAMGAAPLDERRTARPEAGRARHCGHQRDRASLDP